eukprot:g17905.t1
MFGEKYFTDCEVVRGNLVCDCSIAPKVRPLVFEFPAGGSIVLRPSEMFVKVGQTHDMELCLTGLAANPQPIWILGDVFLRQVFAVHAFKRREVALFPYHPEKVAETLETWGADEGGAATTVAAVATLVAAVSALWALRRGKEPEKMAEPLLPPIRPEVQSVFSMGACESKGVTEDEIKVDVSRHPAMQSMDLTTTQTPWLCRFGQSDGRHLGSCTANALAAAFHFALHKENVEQHEGFKDFTPSRLFIYYNERYVEGSVDRDAGAMLRDGILGAAGQGQGSWCMGGSPIQNEAHHSPISQF